MKKLLFLLLIIPALANATVTTSCTPGTRATTTAPLAIILVCTATTSSLYPKGTGTGYLTNGTFAQGVTSINVNTGANTILVGDYIKVAGDTNEYLVSTSTGTPVTNITIPSPGVIPVAGWGSGVAVTVQSNSGNFHNIHCETNFGDPNGSPVSGKYWTNGTGYNTSRNYATGIVVAHVYEVAGTYTATTSCRDAYNGVINSQQNTITVTDPDTVYAGASTKCVYSGTPYGSCPGGGAEVNQANFATALSTYSGANKRILFKRGDSFTMAASGTVTGAGGTLGAYGNSALAKPFISQTASGGQTMVKLASTNNDWRIMDLALDALASGDNASVAIGQAATAPSQITTLRVNVTNVVSAQKWQLATATPDQNAIVDSSFTSAAVGAASGYGVYCATCTNLIMLGNYIDMTGGISTSHDIRVQGVNKLVIANNTDLGTSLVGPLTVRGDTNYGGISDNKLTGQLSINPQNTGSNETQKDIIVERNWLISVSGINGELIAEAVAVTVRNNIFDITNATQHEAVSTSYGNTVGAPMTDRIYIYNNTAINTDSNGFFRAVSGNTACHVFLSNNLAYAASATSPVLITNAGTCSITGASGTVGNSSDNEIKNTDPQFAVASPVNPTDFRIKAASYAANNTGDSAVTLYPAIFDDFFHCKDKTATNFRSGAMVPAANARCFGAAK